MDVDRFLFTHEPSWTRLSELTREAGKTRHGVRRRNNEIGLDAIGVEELVRLYQRASSDLSFCRTYYNNPAINARLTVLVAEAQAVIHGARTSSVRTIVQFFTTSFPGAVWHLRRFVLISALALFLPAIVFGAWLSISDRARDASAPEAYRDAYLARDFENYYSSEPAEQFTTKVFVNNVQVGFLAFGLGVFLCLPTVWLLGFNGINLGFAAGLFTAAGAAPKFWGLILPHGLLELTAVAIAGGAGLALGWCIVSPGDRPRGRALGEEARRAVVLVMGLVPVFLVAGLIEGLVTGRPWHSAIRVGIGVLVWLAFGTYLVIQGRSATRSNFTGNLDELDDLALQVTH